MEHKIVYTTTFIFNLKWGVHHASGQNKSKREMDQIVR